MVLGLVGGIGLVVCALAVWLTTRAAATGALGLNAFAGIRTPATMASDAAWRAGHQAALPAATTTAAASAGIGIVLVLAGLLADADESPLLCLLVRGRWGSAWPVRELLWWRNGVSRSSPPCSGCPLRRGGS